ncbi:MAG: serine/threonine protein kinase [Polyangiaceae bacterium]|nr:serine/threonine protein kinase [Polyangiaceae bacterium]
MSANSSDDGVPETFRNGRYVVTGVLGEGSQGETLEAVDKLRGCPVALKRFRIKGARSWKDVELAEREARVLSTLDHPNLPRYVDHFEQSGCLFLVTELISGTTLSAWRSSHASLDESDVFRLLDDARSALGYLHHRVPPVIHRDIKPANVIRRADGSFAFVDFGAVRDSLKPEGGSTVVGTFGFMAPEQFQGRALPASDVYSVGATALCLLTGRDPEDLPHVGLGIDVRQALGPSANPSLVSALSAMLEPDPDRRASEVPSVYPTRGVPTPATQAPGVRPAGPHVAWPWHGANWDAGHAPWRGAGRAWPHGYRRPPWARGLRARGPTSLVPFLVAAVVVLLLLGARMAAFATLRMVLPVVLMMLGLRRAASAVIRAGTEAEGALRNASRRLRGVSDWSAPAGGDTSGRTGAAAGQVRVSVPDSSQPRPRTQVDEAGPDQADTSGSEASRRVH